MRAVPPWKPYDLNPLAWGRARRSLRAWLQRRPPDLDPADLERVAADALGDDPQWSLRSRKVVQGSFNGTPCWVRVYARGHVAAYLRSVGVREQRAMNGLCLPKIIARGWVKQPVAAGVIVEEVVDAEPITVWSREVGVALGRGLRQWHGVAVNQFKVPVFEQWTRETYIAHLRAAADAATAIDPTDGELLHDILAMAEADAMLFDGMAASHGDLRKSNMLFQGGAQQIAWLDLDCVMRRPAWHDLAIALFGLLRNDAEAIEACEAAYFGGQHPDEIRFWRGFRGAWARVYCALRAGDWLIGHDAVGDDRAAPARRYIALAQAVPIVDDDTSTVAMVQQLRANYKEKPTA